MQCQSILGGNNMTEIGTNLNGFGTALAKINEPDFSLKAIIGGRETRTKALVDVIRLGIEQQTFTDIRGINAQFSKEGYSKNLLSVLKEKSILVNNTGKRNRWALSENIVAYITDAPDGSTVLPGVDDEQEAETTRFFETNLQGKFKDLWEFLFNHPQRELDLLLLKQEIVEEAAEKLNIEKQFVWDTIRKLENQNLLKRVGRKDNGLVIEFKTPSAKAVVIEKVQAAPSEEEDERVETVQGRADEDIAPPAPLQDEVIQSTPLVESKSNTGKGDTTLSQLRSTLALELEESGRQIQNKESGILAMQKEVDALKARHEETTEFLRKIEEYSQ